MGFQTPLYELSDYLKWTTSGKIQLPDFQRGYKWEDERIRQLLVTILRGHPLGVVMLLKAGNDQIRFKPRPIEGVAASSHVEPDSLLLDGQQRLTSLTQALTGDGVVATEDARGKKLSRRYYIHMKTALAGDDRIDDAVISVPGDGVVRTNFGKDVELDLSDGDKERAAGYFPVRLLFGGPEMVTWLFALEDKEEASHFHANIVQPASTYNIPAIELDTSTSKSAVATVFEKVNTGGLPLKRIRASDRDIRREQGLLRRDRPGLPPQRRLGGDPEAAHAVSGACWLGEHRLSPNREPLVVLPRSDRDDRAERRHPEA